MKYLLLILILFSCISTDAYSKNKTLRTSKVKAVKIKKVKLKKSKLSKQYKFNELSKRQKRLKLYKNIQVTRGPCPAYNFEYPHRHWRMISKKLNPNACNHIRPLDARKVMKGF